MFLYTPDVVGILFYFTLFLHFISLFLYFIILLYPDIVGNYLLYPDVMGN